jgi:cell division septal protein FtsQ
MWFKRKSRNRRLRTGTVLDVKLRSDQARAARMRAVAVCLGVTFATVLCVGLLWAFGEWMLNQLVFENSAFAIAEIDARTDGVVAPEQIKRWAGVKSGANLMALDLARVKRDLELQPLVRTVAVERVLPHTLRIRVIEREPVAQVNVARARAGGGVEMTVYHLDDEAHVMLPLDPRLRSSPPTPADNALPVISGVDPLALKVGRQVDSAQVQAALDLVEAFQSSPMAAYADLKRVDVTAPDVLVVTTGQGAEVTFGLQNLNQQLLRWREIHEQGLRRNKAIATLDLAVPNNIPARWLDAGLLPERELQPKPAKAPRKPAATTRRRSV